MANLMKLIICVGLTTIVLGEDKAVHRVKRQSEPPLTPGLTDSLLTEQFKNRIVARHNELRAGEGATNMLQMAWNRELAAMAQTWANGCILRHDNPASNIFNQRNDVGQNLAANTGSSFDLEGSMTRWWDEKNGYDINSNTCFQEPCGHYTQMAWAGSYLIGCGVAFCPVLTNTDFRNANYFVCNYHPAGNINRARPYVVGTPCSNCPTSHPTCTNDGLCSQGSTGGCTCEEWSEWECNAACNQQGEQVRRKRCSPSACDVETERGICTGSCVGQCSNCGFWGEWSRCSSECGPGHQIRSRQCPAGCPTGIESKACTGTSCCNNCGEWSLWSECSAGCGQQGERQRGRSCSASPGCTLTTERDTCRGQCCQCSGWTVWSSCSSSCGAGVQTKSRRCQGTGCPSERQHQYCFNSCEATGHWGRWSEWGSCSKTCGAATKTRYRQCRGGQRCTGGSGTETTSCNLPECGATTNGGPNGDGWSQCSVTCGRGFQYNLNGMGPSIARPCRLRPCQETNGGECWSKWNPGSRCGGQCGFRTRQCRCRYCAGPRRQYRRCNGIC